METAGKEKPAAGEEETHTQSVSVFKLVSLIISDHSEANMQP